jgi:mannosyltransferase
MDVVDERPATTVLAPRPASEPAPPAVGFGTPRRSGALIGSLRDTAWPPAPWAIGATAAFVAIGILLRFLTRSDMWLDEALTVDISRLPISQIHGALMRDGAPPLYYFLLHFWMKIFGQSDLGARSLSAVISVATLPCLWIAGKRVGSKAVAASVTVLVATSPFAIYYGTEARMYSLVAFLTTVGFIALDSALRAPKKSNLVATALCTALLLYTHYWALYLVLVTGAWLVFQSWRGPTYRRRSARAAFGAVVCGCLLFLPWLPTFIYQSEHTGTPWATPANFAAMVNTVSSFAGGPTNEGRALALLYFSLAGLGLFGVATDRFHISLDLRGRPAARGLGIIVLGTLLVAITGGYLQKSAFSARYASVIFVPLLLLVAMGLGTFKDRRIAAVVLVASAVFGLITSYPNIDTQRSEAFEIAAVLAHAGKPGDIVAYCPDQLGPDTARLLPSDKYDQITFPRQNGPQFVDWVDYAKVVGDASPVAFAKRLEQIAGPDHRIWYVWAPGYQTYGADCQIIGSTLLADKSLGGDEILGFGPFYEPSELVEFAYR